MIRLDQQARMSAYQRLADRFPNLFRRFLDEEREKRGLDAARKYTKTKGNS